MTSLHPYLFFNGNCRKAMEFYQKCLGGELQIMTHAQAPAGEVPAGVLPDSVMHAALKTDQFLLMASDGMPNTPIPAGDNVYLSLMITEEKEAERLFKMLADNGKITMPLEKTFWAARFGTLTDQFGMHWLINCQ